MLFGIVCLFMSSCMMLQGFNLLRREEVAFAKVMFTFSLVMVCLFGLNFVLTTPILM